MKHPVLLIVLLLTSCQTVGIHMQFNNSKKDKGNAEEMVDVPCTPASTLLDFEGDNCNLQEWHLFLTKNLTMNPEQREQQLHTLDMRYSPDQLKHALITLNSSLSEIEYSKKRNTVEGFYSRLPRSLELMIDLYVEQSQLLRQQSKQLDTLSQQKKALLEKVLVLKNQLVLSEAKIKALTEIEQQLNHIDSYQESKENTENEKPAY